MKRIKTIQMKNLSLNWKMNKKYQVIFHLVFFGADGLFIYAIFPFNIKYHQISYFCPDIVGNIFSIRLFIIILLCYLIIFKYFFIFFIHFVHIFCIFVHLIFLMIIKYISISVKLPLNSFNLLPDIFLTLLYLVIFI